MQKNNNLKSRHTLKKIFLWGRLIFFLIIILIGGMGGVDVKAQGGTTTKNVRGGGTPEEKLSFRLQLLAQPAIGVQSAESQAQILSLPVSGPGSLLKNEAGEILVYIRLDEVSPANLRSLTDTGAKIVHIAEEYRIVTAYVAFDQLGSVAAVIGVESIQEELTPQTSGVSIDYIQHQKDGIAPASPQTQYDCPYAITSEGYGQLGFAVARILNGVTGTGVTVGILSDSYDNSTSILPTDAAADIASGDLPGPGNPCGRTTPVNILREGEGSNLKDEGRAMLQIVHDLVPPAHLAFASATGGQFDFADQIRALRTNAGADVIADDIFYYSDPFFQDGPITQGIKDVTNSGALYFTLAGNHHEVVNGQAIGSYEAPAFRPTSCPSGLPVWVGPNCHDFNPGAGIDNMSSFTLFNGGRIDVNFQWAEPWYGVETDFDIFLLNASNTILAESTYTNGTTQTPWPWEYFSYTNNTGSNQTVYLVINRYSGTFAPRLKYILPQNTFWIATVEYNASNSSDIFGPTVYGHSGANEAISVAAVPYDDSTTPEDFTSRGFPTYYFGPVVGTNPAAPLATPETRQKPDVGATDGGRNTFFGDFDGANYRFYGTSAAAPHAAAVGALMKERATQLDRFLNQSIAESIIESIYTEIPSGSPEANGVGLISAWGVTLSYKYTVPLQKSYLPIVLKN